MIKVTYYDWGHEGVNGWVSKSANSSGGVSVKYDVKNYGKPVTKFTVYFKAYNGADEVVSCTIRNEYIRGVRSTDYIGENDKVKNLLFENAWYNHSIRYIAVDKIDVVYSDGTTETCDGENCSPSIEEMNDLVEKRGCSEAFLAFIILIIIFVIAFIIGNL